MVNAGEHLTESGRWPPNFRLPLRGPLAVHSGGEDVVAPGLQPGMVRIHQLLFSAPMKNLREIVERYAALAGSFGNPVALAAFGLGAEETQKLFAGFDEDYHISRFLHFSRAEGESYVISEEPVTHVAIDPAIYSIL